jgi:heme A synthase
VFIIGFTGEIMNGAHFHLLVNHSSLFALVIGTAVLAASMMRKSVDLRVLAVVLFVLAGLFGWISVESGEKAADIVKTLGGGADPFVNEHADAATWAERSGFFVAVLAIAMEVAVRKKTKWVKPLSWALLIFAFHGCTVFARTAYLGGLIRHTEVR